MSRLIVIIGFDGQGSASNPIPVYVGRSGAEGEAAIAADFKSARFEILKNPVTLRKNNPKYTPAAPPLPVLKEAPPHVPAPHSAAAKKK